MPYTHRFCDPNLCPYDFPCNAVEATVDGGQVAISTFGCTGDDGVDLDFGDVVNSAFMSFAAPKSGDDGVDLDFGDVVNSAFMSFAAPKSGCAKIDFTFVAGEDFDDEVEMVLLAANACDAPFFFELDTAIKLGRDRHILYMAEVCSREQGTGLWSMESKVTKYVVIWK